ncbi:hypothetical protein GCM10029978_103150 [Actinoallomurus acanthiterrae]
MADPGTDGPVPRSQATAYRRSNLLMGSQSKGHQLGNAAGVWLSHEPPFIHPGICGHPCARTVEWPGGWESHPARRGLR